MAKARSTRRNRPATDRKRVLVVTGSRSEFGLLRPVMDAVKKHRGLELLVVVAGEHLLKPALTVREVEKAYRIAARVPMQRVGDRTRADHAAATARGMQGFAGAFKRLKPEWVVVLGDRIEAFAAASAASIAGTAVCHIHGGDRAEGIADEAMRHAITKLSHLHCAATKLSAERIVKMGERKEHVHVTGSPAIDGLGKIKPMGDREARRFGNPSTLVILHPTGRTEWGETLLAMETAWIAQSRPGRILWLAPNFDPGRNAINRQRLEQLRPGHDVGVDHIERHHFLSLLKRLARDPNGAILGNSSSGLLESAAVGLPAINVSERQRGREHGSSVLTLGEETRIFCADLAAGEVEETVARHIESKRARRRSNNFGDGRAGPRIAALLANTDSTDPALLRKHNSY